MFTREQKQQRILEKLKNVKNSKLLEKNIFKNNNSPCFILTTKSSGGVDKLNAPREVRNYLNKLEITNYMYDHTDKKLHYDVFKYILTNCIDYNIFSRGENILKDLYYELYPDGFYIPNDEKTKKLYEVYLDNHSSLIRSPITISTDNFYKVLIGSSSFELDLLVPRSVRGKVNFTGETPDFLKTKKNWNSRGSSNRKTKKKGED